MRKNNVNNKGISALKTTYIIKGLNLDRLINTLKNRKIDLYNIKKTANNRLYLTVNFSDRQKVFAIAKELCYNIKKVRDGGKALPFLQAYRTLGVIIGVFIISLTAIFLSDVIFSFEFTGGGKIYKRQVEDYLAKTGVHKYSRFSDLDIKRLEDQVLANMPNLSFVGCKKVGGRLVFDLELSTDKVETLKGNVYAMYSDFDGVIKEIKVYRGTNVVSVGDVVKKGDLLVDGYAVVKDQVVKINVLAVVTVSVTKEYVYRSEFDDQSEKALILAQENFNQDVQSSTVDCSFDGKYYIYKVKINFDRIVRAG